jgi:hypothetical protein|tara:strand:+ start:2425 stop:3630 length:1206 start_codon:yes stop_codon:yes gene_type:complete
MNQVTKVIHDNELYECVENELFVTYRKQDVEEASSIAPIWKGHKIPRGMWKSILSFMKHSYDEFKSETLVYLFYDVADANPWSWWVPPQETAGMTVKSCPESKDFIEQRKHFPDTMFGTVHHHCSSSAFQSGTDEADEVDREGIHFTVGNLDQDDAFDLHCRITLGGLHAEIPAETYISMAPDPFKKTANITNVIRKSVTKQLHSLDVAALPHLWANDDFKEELANVSKRIYSYPKARGPLGNTHYWNSGKATGTYNGSQEHWTWDDEEDLTPKKNQTDHENFKITSIEDLADSFVDAVKMDYEYEDLLANYYSHYGYNDRLQRLYVSDVPDADIRKELKEVLSNYQYCNTEEGKEMLAITNNYIQEHQAESLDFTINDLIYGLGNEERTTIQHMVTEDVS